MMVFILAFVALLLIVTGMALGAIFQNKPLKGSCGGLNSLGLKDGCEICGGNDDECKKEQERQAKRTELAYDATAVGPGENVR
ncbi:(Na+)-NQR maturation NqrM [Microbulbifer thermotolerans]|uniref:(Na+)-NQR maturation NqrM n=1 Tax=Microbulbifer thermotolerans TaxID=252514 RepID=UPI0022489BAB|nr:(Na+)-NQR maturation NqrM [Microbulbifer thermotolerans]MCX2832777.1 (Na+)-NQR maturation NqrM [Microbulbifer thermotolerans]